MFDIKRKINNFKYRRKNKHNYTFLKKMCDINLISVGKETYGGITAITHSGDNGKLLIGNYCSIADKVVFLLGGEHFTDKFTTYPFLKKYLNISEARTKGNIVVHDDVWIGYDSLILSGVEIGQGAIIGARSVVSKNVPPYSIFVGNKVIKYRFSDYIIKKLLEIDFSSIDPDFFIKNNKFLNTCLDENNVDDFLSLIEEDNK